MEIQIQRRKRMIIKEDLINVALKWMTVTVKLSISICIYYKMVLKFHCIHSKLGQNF